MMATNSGDLSSALLKDRESKARGKAADSLTRKALKEYNAKLNAAMTAFSKVVADRLLVYVASKGKFNDYTGNLRYSFGAVVDNEDGQSYHSLSAGDIKGVRPGQFSYLSKRYTIKPVKRFYKDKNGNIRSKSVKGRVAVRVANVQRTKHKVRLRRKRKLYDKSPKRYLRDYESGYPVKLGQSTPNKVVGSQGVTKRQAAAIRRDIGSSRSRRKVQIRVFNLSPYAMRQEALGYLIPQTNVMPVARRSLTALKNVVQDLSITEIKKMFREFERYHGAGVYKQIFGDIGNKYEYLSKQKTKEKFEKEFREYIDDIE